MKRFFMLAFCALLVGSAGVAEEKPVPVSIVQLIVTPERFDGKLVRVTGFFGMGERAALSLHREDAEHGLASNSIGVIPSEEMRHNKEKFDGMYVAIVGVFHAAPAEGGWLVPQIRDIKQCYVVSDPFRPIKRYGKSTESSEQDRR